MGRRRKDAASLDASGLLDAPTAFAATALSEEASASEEVVIVAAYHDDVPVTAPTNWLVLEDAFVSLFGQMTTLAAGTVVSARSYGPEGVRRIMEQGVLLEPLP